MGMYFRLLRPENLPVSLNELHCDGILQETLDKIINLSYKGDDKLLLLLTRQSLQTLEPFLQDVTIIENDSEESAENKANDQSFNILRVNGNVMYIFAYSVLQSYEGMLEEVVSVGTDLSPNDWGKLRLAYHAIFNMLFGNLIKANLNPSSIIALNPQKPIGDNNGMRRWIQGHYVFMSIIQGLVVALNCFYRDFKAGNIPAACTDMNMAAILMMGSEAALKFTGNFSHDDYEKFVRPSLSPPIAPPGMSGVNWRDHEYMIKKVFNKLRPIFSDPPSTIKKEIESFLKALGCTYDAHKFVCTFFVGEEKSSLLSKKSAAQMLENYKNNRIRLLQKELQT